MAATTTTTTMTKLDYLKKCRDMWQWLAEHPDKGKADYMVTLLGLSTEVWPFNCCWACECDNVFNPENNPCSANACSPRCILKNLWPLGCQSDPNSPYPLWDRERQWGKLKDATRHALLIVKGCDEAIKEYKEDGQAQVNTKEDPVPAVKPEAVAVAGSEPGA